MWESTTNLEKVLDAKTDEAGLQLPEWEKAFEDKFKDKTNRVTLVKEATKGFDWLEDKTKTEIKDQSVKEIKSRWAEPKEWDEGYSAKIAVLYLYTTLAKGTKNASLDDVKITYNELIAADVQEKQTANETAAKLEAEKKEATGSLTTKLDEYTKTKDLYSAKNWEALVYSQTNWAKEITAAETPEKVIAARDLALKSMDNIFTLDEEKAAELKKVIDDKKTEQKEVTDKPVEYTEKDGKRGQYVNTTFQVPSISALKGGASYDSWIWEAPITFFQEDETLTNFMNKTPDLLSDEKTFNYITKHYASLSKNDEIKEAINDELIFNMENEKNSLTKKNKSLKFEDINSLTWVTLQINDTTWDYYFDIPVSNLKEGKKANKGVNSIHVYFNTDKEVNNVVINEWEEKTTKDISLDRQEALVEGSENLTDNTGSMMDDGQQNVIKNIWTKNVSPTTITRKNPLDDIKTATENWDLTAQADAKIEKRPGYDK